MPTPEETIRAGVNGVANQTQEMRTQAGNLLVSTLAGRGIGVTGRFGDETRDMVRRLIVLDREQTTLRRLDGQDGRGERTREQNARLEALGRDRTVLNAAIESQLLTRIEAGSATITLRDARRQAQVAYQGLSNMIRDGIINDEFLNRLAPQQGSDLGAPQTDAQRAANTSADPLGNIGGALSDVGMRLTAASSTGKPLNVTTPTVGGAGGPREIV